MRKIVVFVEGQSELIFTRELLLKCYEWQGIQLECYTLFNNQDLNPVPYAFPNPNASIHYQLLNIGNDRKVVSTLLKREPYLFGIDKAFDKIVGLRDMYSKEYREVVGNHQIDPAINQRFIEEHRRQIEARAIHPDRINFHFAIMEVESWILGMNRLFIATDESAIERINTALDVNLEEIDPEQTIFHPAKLMSEIGDLIGLPYGKSRGDVNAVLGRLTKEDFHDLYICEKCQSFTDYCDALEVNTAPTNQ